MTIFLLVANILIINMLIAIFKLVFYALDQNVAYRKASICETNFATSFFFRYFSKYLHAVEKNGDIFFEFIGW